MNEQKIHLKFCFKFGKTPTETYSMLIRVYEDQALSMKFVFEWFSRFRGGRESVSDKPRSERPATSVSDENVEKTHASYRFVEWAQNEIAVVPDFHKRILFSDEAHFWLNGYVNKQNRRIWNEANPQVYVETPLHPEKLTVWCALWAGGILLQNR
ncbi:uncharacterized protein TNCV_1460461 [Trichonephila clavipes]|nr:uncharacterized protein TNCV_1460461 [Trichonephila clavipes]